MKNLISLFVLFSSILLSACNWSNNKPEKIEQPEITQPIKLKVGYIPIADCSQLYVGIEKGFFKEEGLEVEAMKFAGGPKIMEALIGGSLDIGFSNLVSVIMANDNGIEIRTITGGPVEDSNHIENAILVLKNGSIKKPKDLEGKKVAVNTKKNIIELMFREYLIKNSVNASKIEFVEMPFPNMQNTLISKQVDAVCSIEPFVSFAKKDDKISVLSSYVTDVTPRLEISSYNSTKKWIIDNPETVKRFKMAMTKTTKYCLEHPEVIKPILVKYTGLTEEQLSDVTLPTFTESLTESNLQFLIDKVKGQGWTKQDIKAVDLIN